MFQQQLNLNVRDVMSLEYMTFEPLASYDTVLEAMLCRNLQDAFILDRGVLKGMVTLADVARLKNAGANLATPVGNYLQSDLYWISPDEPLKTGRDRMRENQVGRLPVLENGVLKGVIREKELREFFYMRLEEYNNQLSQVLDALHEAVCVTDREGVVILWNRSSEKLYKVTKEEILGMPIGKFFPNAMTLKVLKSQKPIWNMYHAPRENFHVVLSTEPIFVDGELVGAVSTDRDVTEMTELSKQLEQATSAVKYLEDQVKQFTKSSFDAIVGTSDSLMKRVRIAEQVAKTEATILISGESGTGKEVFSRAIHEASERKGLFVPLNCSAIPAGLFESELFGYVEGAFTGARKSGKMGVFEIANTGTVFLDEIGEMPLHMQAKLLRVLQEREICRVGSEKIIKVNTRVISASNRDLKQLVKEGKFREDLYYRLNVVEIDLPPLRERRSDIPILIASFLKELCEKEGRPKPMMDPEVIGILENYQWEGNVRQLKNTVEYLMVMSPGDRISREQIPSYILNDVQPVAFIGEQVLDLTAAVARVEFETIRTALEKTNRNRAAAAKLLNIPRTTLYYKMQQYNLEKI